jgi:hypothetical protein
MICFSYDWQTNVQMKGKKHVRRGISSKKQFDVFTPAANTLSLSIHYEWLKRETQKKAECRRYLYTHARAHRHTENSNTNAQVHKRMARGDWGGSVNLTSTSLGTDGETERNNKEQKTENHDKSGRSSFPALPHSDCFFFLFPLSYNWSNLRRAQLRMQEHLQIKGEVRTIIQWRKTRKLRLESITIHSEEA